MALLGMYLDSQASKKVNDARAAVLNEERQRQAAFDAENTAFNTGAQNRYIDFGTQTDARGKQLGDYFSTPIAVSPTVTPASVIPANSSLMASELAKQFAKSAAYGDQQAKALGNLRGFGDLMGSTGRLQAQDANKIGQINGFKRGSANAAQYELDAASHAGDADRYWSNLLGGIENVATSAFLGGGLKLPNMFGSGASSANFGAPSGGYYGTGGVKYPGPGYYP